MKRTLALILLPIIFCCMIVFGVSDRDTNACSSYSLSVPWAQGDYGYRRQISVNADAYISSDLTDFTVAIQMPSGNEDIIWFTDCDGTPIIIKDKNVEEGIYGVVVPVLYADKATKLYVYYNE